ncbi:MAG TPA: hypothetical protein VIH58_10240 [Chthoniobacterales bacterium]
MFDQSREKKVHFLAKPGVAAFIMLLASFSLQATSAAAQKNKADGLTDSAIEAALQKALPGAVPAHSGHGVLGFQNEGMGSTVSPRFVNMSDLAQATHFRSEEEGGQDRPLSGLTEEQYQAVKRLVARREAAGEIGAAPSSALPLAYPASKPPGPPSVGANIGFFAQSEVCCDPPDMALAVSENFVLQMVNNYVAVYDKRGNLQSGFPIDADDFFDLPAGTYTTDPRAFYDWDSHRFVVLELTETNTGNPNGPANVGAIAMAVSVGHDPRQGWYVYSNVFQQSSGVCPDFPQLGHDTTNWGAGATKGGIYLGLNLWSGANDCHGDGFTGNVIIIVPKDPLYTGSGFSYWYINNLEDGGTLVDTLQADNVTDRADKPSSIFWTNSFNYNWGNGACSNGCNGLIVWTESGPTSGSACAGFSAGCPNDPFWFLQGGNGPILTGIEMKTAHNYSLPPNAGAPNCKAGSGPCVDTDYTFISGQVKYHAGELFGSFNTGVAVNPAVAGPIWFDVHPVTNNNGQLTAVEERQEDCFLCGGWASNGSAYYASLQPDQENNVLMVFDFSNDANYPGTVYTSRRVTYGDSLMDGAGTYMEDGSGGVSGRWGDYTATAPDFTVANLGLLWFSAQYATSSGGWGTVIGAGEYNTAEQQ